MTRVRGFLIGVVLAALGGCALNPFGGRDRQEANEIAGDSEQQVSRADETQERISVLALDEELAPDGRFETVDLKTPPPYRNLAWPQQGGRADHTLHHLEARFALRRLWSRNLDTRSSAYAPLTSAPVVADGRLFVSDPLARVHAVDAETGDRLWLTALTPEFDQGPRWRFWRRAKPQQVGFGGGVAYEAGRVFTTSGFGFIAALDAETGDELWRVELSGPARTPPSVYQGVVFATTVTNELVALDQADGRELWSFQSFEESARVLASGAPAASGDLVFAPFSSGEIIAFRVQNGRGVWDDTLSRSTQFTSLASLNDIAGAPVVDRGLVFAIGHGGRFAAIDVRSGRRAWEKTIAGVQQPWVAGRYVYVVSVDGELICMAREDGAIAWISDLPRYEYEQKRTGRISWSGPVLAGDALLLTSSNGKLVQVAPEDGRIIGVRKLGDGVFVPPVVADGVVYVLAENGRVTAFR